jgi:hypothetical protein
MDIDRLASLVHTFSATPTRRRVSRSLAGLATGSILAPLIDPISGEAKKKRKKKHKKKKDPPPACPSGQKRCGDQCISASGCCASGDCGANRACVGHACQCASGFVQTCDGNCIPDEPGLVVCCEPNILCEHECCDVAAAQVCHVSPSAADTCQAGGCPAGGLCQREDFYACGGRNALDIIGLCECTSPIEGGPGVCVSTESLDCNHTCTSSSGCGAGAVCIANGEHCGCEETVVGFCGTLCSEGCGANCSRNATSRTHHQAGSAWMDVLAPKLKGRKRSQHR